LLSDEHFTVDGTLIEAWAGRKSFKRKDGKDPKPPSDDDPGNPSVDFHGERRSNQTHRSTTDPEAQLARKGPGKEAKLSFAAHTLMDNREGLAVGGCVNQATGRAEPQAALQLVEEIPGWGRVTLGTDKGYDRKEFIRNCATIRSRRTSRARPQHYRCPHHPPSRLRDQSAQAQTDRRDLRLAQNRWRLAQDPPSRRRAGRLDVHLCAGGLQPGANPQPPARAA
jgi:hypothetical protein